MEALTIERDQEEVREQMRQRVVIAPTPEMLQAEYALDHEAREVIAEARQTVGDILHGKDPRMLAVVGVCAEDDSLQSDGTPSVLRFGERLSALMDRPEIAEHLYVVMRCPPAKPRSALGMAGLEQENPREARRLLAMLANTKMPLALEIMERDHLAVYGDLTTLGWVGARNNRDTGLRRTLSQYSGIPILCKNGEHGELDPALQTIETMRAQHPNAAITLPNGMKAHVELTTGHDTTGVIWRGGKLFMSHEAFEHGVMETAKTGLPYLIDGSHGNAMVHDTEHKKSVEGQIAAFNHTVQLVLSDTLPTMPKGIMLESYLIAGADTSRGTPGKSWTDPCIDFETLEGMLMQLAGVHATLQER